MKLRCIAIEKFVDPIRDNPDAGLNFEDKPEPYNDYYVYGDTQELDKLEFERIRSEFDSSCKAITTPFGVLPLTEYSFISKYFNLWVCHTNFPLDPYMVLQLEDIDGLEELTPITKHRFRFAVGRLFTVNEVVGQITALLCTPSNMEMEAAVYRDMQQLKEKVSATPYWAILVLPNGRKVYTQAETETEDFLLSVMEYKDVHNAVGGYLWLHSNIDPIIK